MERNPDIDEKIAAAAPFARPILAHLRKVVHETIPDVGEAIKWGMPHFIYKGKNIAGMAAFKAHCAFMIHGEGRQGDGDRGKDSGGMGSFGKIASLDDLPPDTEMIAKLRAAQARIDEGGTTRKRQPAALRPAARTIDVPEDFTVALAANPAAAQVFGELASSHRYEYLEWITGAKREETRTRRIGQALEWLAEGKRRNWKYER